MIRANKRTLADALRGRAPASPITTVRCHVFSGESMEPRLVMSIEPVVVGSVYVEEDLGSDLHGDSFYLTFEGGAPGTQLVRAIINGDQDAPGLGRGDVFFDVSAEPTQTGEGRLGADAAFRFQAISTDGFEIVSVIEVDGSSLLEIEFAGFDAGEVLVFSIDVDEVEQYNPLETDPDVIYDGLDPITSGVEFQGSTLTAHFTAPHFEDATARGTFANRYDPLMAGHGLQLPADDEGGKRDRTAGAVAEQVQQVIPASLRGYVYHDANMDGRFDLGRETGLAGVTIQAVPIDTLLPQAVMTTVTRTDGSYEFQGLAPGRYRLIEVDQPDGYFDWLDQAGTVDGMPNGLAQNPGDLIDDIVLSGGSVGLDFNFGEILPVTIGGRVQLATPDGDCWSEEIEHEPVVDALVQLLSNDGVVVRETRTDADGRYQFESLLPGTYTVREFTPEGLFDGGAKPGRIGPRVVGIVVNESEVGDIDLLSGEAVWDIDFCELEPVEIRGRVQLATPDGDCWSETIEHRPVVGSIVQLANEVGEIIAETVTDWDGRYVFDDLEPGTYSVFQITPEGLFDGGARPGSVGTELRGIVAGPGAITEIMLGPGEALVNADFCEKEPVSIRGRVQLSTADGDCFGDEEDHAPLANVTVRLLNEDGEQVAQTLTDENGRYQFVDLEPGIYSLVEVTPPGVFEGGARIGLIDGTLDPLAILQDPNTITNIVLGPGQDGVHYDFCEHAPSTLSGVVYHDRDNDGQRDANEAGIGQVIVDLLDEQGEIVDSAITNPDGSYQFTNLTAGVYAVLESQPSGWLDGKDTAGTIDGQRVGMASSAQDLIDRITIGWGQQAVDYNFGELLATAIQGRVQLSTVDGDCWSEDRQHDPLPGVLVELLDSNDQILQSTRTNASGTYEFADLLPGIYRVRQYTPSGYLDGGARAGIIETTSGPIAAGVVLDSNNVGLITLESGQQAVKVDFCEHRPSSLGGYVYHDADNDGNRDTSESPIAGVIVILLDESGSEVDRTRTNATGAYRFETLHAGSYTLVELQPDGWIDGLDSVGQVDGVRRGVVDSAADRISRIQLGWGEDGTEYNFGELLEASLAGIVHTDLDDDCVLQAEGERPLAGVLIDLLDANGQVVAQQRTADDGTFRFDRLRPGSYSLREHQPDGFFQGGQLAGTGGGNLDVVDTISAIQVRSGDQLIGYRFCEIPPSELSGYVFQDGATIILEEDETLPDNLSTIRDGRRTPDDRMLSGVTLELRHGVNGRPIDGSEALPGHYVAGQPIRVTTDANGFYRFTGLPAGNYAIYQLQPDGFIDGIDTSGSVEAIALNRHDFDGVKAQMVSELVVDPNFDAIIRIALFPNVTSIENNFSELAVQQRPFRVPMGLPDPTPLRPLAPITWQPPPLTPGPDLPGLNAPLTPFGRFRGVTQNTWHLSVLSGGWPRGAGLNVPTRGPFWLQSSDEYYVAWQDPRAEQLYWVMMVDGRLNRERLFGLAGGIPVAGDFNGDGLTEIGVFYQGQWFIDINGNGRWDESDLWAKLGHDGDQPVVGDWDGDGKDDIGIFGLAWPGDPRAIDRDPGLPDRMNRTRGEEKNAAPPPEEASQGSRELRMTKERTSRSDLIDHVFHFGTTGDQAVAGDWNGDGIANIGVFHKGVWHLDLDGDGRYERENDLEVVFGSEGDVPIVGDFNGDGVDEVGIVSGGRLVLDINRNYRVDDDDHVVPMPNLQGRPVVGDWNGDGIDDVGFASDKIRFVEVDARR